jgi:hypothetical protein
MDFPIQPSMDEDACYQLLVDLFHPERLHVPAAGLGMGLEAVSKP